MSLLTSTITAQLPLKDPKHLPGNLVDIGEGCLTEAIKFLSPTEAALVSTVSKQFHKYCQPAIYQYGVASMNDEMYVGSQWDCEFTDHMRSSVRVPVL